LDHFSRETEKKGESERSLLAKKEEAQDRYPKAAVLLVQVRGRATREEKEDFPSDREE